MNARRPGRRRKTWIVMGIGPDLPGSSPIRHTVMNFEQLLDHRQIIWVQLFCDDVEV